MLCLRGKTIMSKDGLHIPHTIRIVQAMWEYLVTPDAHNSRELPMHAMAEIQTLLDEIYAEMYCVAKSIPNMQHQLEFFTYVSNATEHDFETTGTISEFALALFDDLTHDESTFRITQGHTQGSGARVASQRIGDLRAKVVKLLQVEDCAGSFNKMLTLITAILVMVSFFMILNSNGDVFDTVENAQKIARTMKYAGVQNIKIVQDIQQGEWHAALHHKFKTGDTTDASMISYVLPSYLQAIYKGNDPNAIDLKCLLASTYFTFLIPVNQAPATESFHLWTRKALHLYFVAQFCKYESSFCDQLPFVTPHFYNDFSHFTGRQNFNLYIKFMLPELDLAIQENTRRLPKLFMTTLDMLETLNDVNILDSKFPSFLRQDSANDFKESSLGLKLVLVPFDAASVDQSGYVRSVMRRMANGHGTLQAFAAQVIRFLDFIEQYMLLDINSDNSTIWTRKVGAKNLSLSEGTAEYFEEYDRIIEMFETLTMDDFGNMSHYIHSKPQGTWIHTLTSKCEILETLVWPPNNEPPLQNESPLSISRLFELVDTMFLFRVPTRSMQKVSGDAHEFNNDFMVRVLVVGEHKNKKTWTEAATSFVRKCVQFLDTGISAGSAFDERGDELSDEELTQERVEDANSNNIREKKEDSDLHEERTVSKEDDDVLSPAQKAQRDAMMDRTVDTTGVSVRFDYSEKEQIILDITQILQASTPPHDGDESVNLDSAIFPEKDLMRLHTSVAPHNGDETVQLDSSIPPRKDLAPLLTSVAPGALSLRNDRRAHKMSDPEKNVNFLLLDSDTLKKVVTWKVIHWNIDFDDAEVQSLQKGHIVLKSVDASYLQGFYFAWQSVRVVRGEQTLQLLVRPEERYSYFSYDNIFKNALQGAVLELNVATYFSHVGCIFVSIQSIVHKWVKLMQSLWQKSIGFSLIGSVASAYSKTQVVPDQIFRLVFTSSLLFFSPATLGQMTELEAGDVFGHIDALASLVILITFMTKDLSQMWNAVRGTFRGKDNLTVNAIDFDFETLDDTDEEFFDRCSDVLEHFTILLDEQISLFPEIRDTSENPKTHMQHTITLCRIVMLWAAMLIHENNICRRFSRQRSLAQNYDKTIEWAKDLLEKRLHGTLEDETITAMIRWSLGYIDVIKRQNLEVMCGSARSLEKFVENFKHTCRTITITTNSPTQPLPVLWSFFKLRILNILISYQKIFLSEMFAVTLTLLRNEEDSTQSNSVLRHVRSKQLAETQLFLFSLAPWGKFIGTSNRPFLLDTSEITLFRSKIPGLGINPNMNHMIRMIGLLNMIDFCFVCSFYVPHIDKNVALKRLHTQAFKTGIELFDQIEKMLQFPGVRSAADRGSRQSLPPPPAVHIHTNLNLISDSRITWIHTLFVDYLEQRVVTQFTNLVTILMEFCDITCTDAKSMQELFQGLMRARTRDTKHEIFLNYQKLCNRNQDVFARKFEILMEVNEMLKQSQCEPEQINIFTRLLHNILLCNRAWVLKVTFIVATKL
jgi:hypothetical protein